MFVSRRPAAAARRVGRVDVAVPERAPAARARAGAATRRAQLIVNLAEDETRVYDEGRGSLSIESRRAPS